MLVRANSLSMARSGVRGEVIELLCAMINHDIVPVVPLRGTVSSSGDLMCLSYIAAAMNGDKKDALVYYKGVKNVTTQEAFNRAGLSFIQFHPKGCQSFNRLLLNNLCCIPCTIASSHTALTFAQRHWECSTQRRVPALSAPTTSSTLAT